MELVLEQLKTESHEPSLDAIARIIDQMRESKELIVESNTNEILLSPMIMLT